MNRSTNPYKRHRFQPAIIRYAGWLFPTSRCGCGAPEQAQRFLSAHAVDYGLFNLQRHLASAALYRHRRARAFECWNEAAAA